MNDIKIVKSLEPYCFQIEYNLDHAKLIDSTYILLDRLGQNIDTIHQELISSNLLGYGINLTHLPGLTGNDRFLKYTGYHGDIKNKGIRELDFVEHLVEAQDLYIGKVIRDLYNQHNGKFQGRASLTWVGPNHRYNYHRDLHTPNRYHIPIITNRDCYFLLRDTNTYHLHMPIGTVWYLDPIGIEHTFINNSNSPRLHLLLTSGF